MKEDRCGEELLGTLNELNMHILNEETVLTCHTIRGKTFQIHVDITACSESRLEKVQEWHVDKGITMFRP